MLNSHYAVVMGLSPTGLYVMRELGEEGIPVVGVSDIPQAGHFSRYLTKSISNKVLDGDGAELVEQLLTVAEKSSEKGVLIPTSDKYIEFIVEFRELLLPHFLFQDSYNEKSYESIVDKGNFYQLCREYGIPYPEYWEVPKAQLQTVSAKVRYPCLLKPTLIHRVRDFMAGRKVLIADNQDEFSRLAENIPDSGSDWLVQEIVPGSESNITLFGSYFDRSGRPHQSFSCEKLRQYPPGFGSASLVCSRLLKETREVSEQFLTALGFHGIAGTEFKWDERDQVYKIIEINPRPTLWFGVSHHSGKRIALAAFMDMTGEEMPPEIEQKDGVYWRYLGKDLYSILFYRFKSRGFVLPAPDFDKKAFSMSKKRVGAVFDRSDIGPVFGEYINYARKAFLRLFRL